MSSANNPAALISSDSLRKIYSGEITNRSDVGGNNEEIVTYKHCKDSGSQASFLNFMGFPLSYRSHSLQES
jgi:phosphate transport system substrate-binding protein